MVTIRRIEADDWLEFRAMRLAALVDAPYAFRSTLEDWTGAGDTEERWRDRLVNVPFNLVADLDGCPVGMASATAPTNNETELISMWVAPEARGQGVGDSLIEAIIAWARENHVARVALDVRLSNHPAVALYARNGFGNVGGASEPDDPFPERKMVRQLS